jgi:hypothetical protein
MRTNASGRQQNRKKTKQNKRKEKSRTVQQIVEIRNEFINH